ncbi:MAG TPA: hypothetical protein VHL98_19940 [Microvirga sp.]|jgi:hypothetical protein|nr:hypothetical protein [Microvirga sp.]
MLTRSELPENPVALQVADGGDRHVVTAERVRGGQVRIGCTCRTSAAEGWCGHQVQLLCLRYDAVVERDGEAEFHFEDIVMGTPLADLADEVDLALAEYDAAHKGLEAKRSAGFDPDRLRRLAALATDLAQAASHLDGALARFKKRLAAGRA